MINTRNETWRNAIMMGVLFMVVLLPSCRQRAGQQAFSAHEMIDSLIPEYSHSFRINYYKDYKIIKVFGKDSGRSETCYILSRPGFEFPSTFKGYGQKIQGPVNRIACMSTTHVGALSILDARSTIVAVTNKELINDSLVRLMLDGSKIKDIGKDYQPDYEIVARAKPDILFSDGENSGSSQMQAKMRSLGIKVVSSRDYFEQEPLARAEWIKFFAAFIDKEKLADSIFKVVKANYLKPYEYEREAPATVFCNLPYNGVWYMPCGENYTGKLISDAGGEFLWNSDKPMNGLNLTLNFEQVYQRAVDADIWLNTGTYTSIAQIAAQDVKFKMFKACKTGEIYNGTKRRTAGGGMDIWETGAFRPDIIRQDLISIFSHGDTYYYEKLK